MACHAPMHRGSAYYIGAHGCCVKDCGECESGGEPTLDASDMGSAGVALLRAEAAEIIRERDSARALAVEYVSQIATLTRRVAELEAQRSVAVCCGMDSRGWCAKCGPASSPQAGPGVVRRG